MDTYRANLTDHAWTDQEGLDAGQCDTGADDDELQREAPPASVGQDERRMQVRAYNHWASLLHHRTFPAIADLDPAALPDFGPYSVLLDFSAGLQNPAIRFLGDKLAAECDAPGNIATLADIPSRSLLSRITDHYMQILANQAPIGFEAEFVNQREQTILYRGILLPFSSNDETIDFIHGVINWKELADQSSTDALLLEIDQVLNAETPDPRRAAPLTDWADGPAQRSTEPEPRPAALDLPLPTFGHRIDPRPDEMSLDELGLADWLAAARALAETAQGAEDRTRQALYAAIGRAYDFSLAAARAPDEFARLVSDAGLTIQRRAPLTPVVKLVFGPAYDKTRLTEYAAALGHAHRHALPRGTFADYLAAAPGGLKGVVSAERRLKRAAAESLRPSPPAPRAALMRQLRQLAGQPLAAVAEAGSEFTLLVARRLPSGGVLLLGEIGDDTALLERAARKLIDGADCAR